MKSLPWITKLCYGVGHIFNDLCASMWFSYLLIFYEKVLQFDPTTAGLVLLVGQIADGLSTPIVGIFSDKENKIPLFAKYGRRKIWHLMGTVLVALSFPFIFNSCLGCRGESRWLRLTYYVVFVCVFQFGWACIQISHLALIPDLTSKKHQRTELNSIRYAFTVLSNLSVFAVTFLVLKTSSTDDENLERVYRNTNCTDPQFQEIEIEPVEKPCYLDTVGPEDVQKFNNVALICVAVGIFFSIVFHFGVKEPKFQKVKTQQMTRIKLSLGEEGKEERETDVEEEESKKIDTDESPASVSRIPYRRMRKRDWFKELPFYQIAIIYLATRLYVNLYQVYMPLYIQETLNLSETYIASVPFAMFLAGFFSSLLMKYINKKIGRKCSFALGCIVGLGGCLWIWLGAGNYYIYWGIFVVAALLGMGGSVLLITSLSFTADLIGQNVEGAAFVYGFMSLADKLSNGIIIMLIQDFNPEEGWYYRSVIAFACGSACLLGIFVTLTLMKTKVGHREGKILNKLPEQPDSEVPLRPGTSS
ncbi:Major facilitator superfamily domain-containing protein 12 [Halocaridina rubra]|uniref:Major facilitator superfamily domain-containing protein 12 n=1 Tax=Halocaridina rubra TaxID=373956 RepID=A0AAN9FUC8_HALRR